MIDLFRLVARDRNGTHLRSWVIQIPIGIPIGIVIGIMWDDIVRWFL